MMNLRYLPIVFDFPLGVHGGMLSVLHLQGELVEDGQDVLEALRRVLGLQSSYLWHQTIYYKAELAATRANSLPKLVRRIIKMLWKDNVRKRRCDKSSIL